MSAFFEHFTTPSGIEMRHYTETRPCSTAIIDRAHGLNYEVKPMRAGYAAEITDDGDLLIYQPQLCATNAERAARWAPLRVRPFLTCTRTRADALAAWRPHVALGPAR